MTATLQVPVGPDDHASGPEDAPVTLVEYGDFECPHCGAAYPILKSVLAHFHGQVRFVFRHFPLTQAHPHAASAAEMSELAAEHDRFWPMHDRLFENQHALDDVALVRYLAALDIPAREAVRVLDDHEFAKAVRADFRGGVRSGVNGTPTFFINGVRLVGRWDETSMIDALRSAGAAPQSGRDGG
jgi:protein-disulfide isomerase